MSETPQQTPRAALIVGAGSGTGRAIARRFAAEGFIACVARRDADALTELVDQIEADGGKARAFGLDATDEPSVEALFEQIEESVAPIEVAVYNAGGFARGPVQETTVKTFHQMWAMSALGGFLIGRGAARRMRPRGRGTILFTGATASVKGSAQFAAFASGKHALRALAQSMARELGPAGIHVAHTVIDGIIDVPRSREMMSDYLDSLGEDGALSPEAIAEMYWVLHQQPRSAWTFELDLRPFKESW